MGRGVASVALRFWRRRSRTVLDRYNAVLSWVVALGVLWLVLVWDAPESRAGLLQRLILAASLLLTRAGALVAGRLHSALWIGTAAAVAFAWSWAEPGGEFGNPRHRAAFAMAALGAMSILYGWGLVKLPWSREGMVRAAWRAMPLHVGLTGVAMLITLVCEAAAYASSGSAGVVGPLRHAQDWPVNALVGVTILSLAVTAILWAVVPGRDPLMLSERGRMGYVFAAEALLGLLFAHIRLTMPQLFSGWIEPYWPLIVMAIAFVGVGLGEFFRRRESRVLALPLERTGALLPLLPVLGFWYASRVDYAAQLVLVGMLYTAMAVTRRSFGFGLLAALAGNGSLWVFLHGHEGLGFFDHPQLWLIPASLCVLLGAQLNKRNLTPGQLAAIRYPSLMCVYVSSTAEIFMAGVATTPWLPLLLCAMSVAGVLAGMAMRVRSFLFMGGAFFGMSLVTILAHAAKRYDAAWLWWAGGITMGLAILGLFAYFERQRSKVTHVVQRLREWDA